MRALSKECAATLGWGLPVPCLILGSGSREEGFRLPGVSSKAGALSAPCPGEPHLMLREAMTQVGRASQQHLDQTKALLSH